MNMNELINLVSKVEQLAIKAQEEANQQIDPEQRAYWLGAAMAFQTIADKARQHLQVPPNGLRWKLPDDIPCN